MPDPREFSPKTKTLPATSAGNPLAAKDMTKTQDRGVEYQSTIEPPKFGDSSAQTKSLPVSTTGKPLAARGPPVNEDQVTERQSAIEAAVKASKKLSNEDRKARNKRLYGSEHSPWERAVTYDDGEDIAYERRFELETSE